ncbi:unannotated protein [freshwater metagenome]|uniref:Unannotated protein n=1 Tax=freshwater metagenome TaxID=449393 RepID=A0A6J7F154_9ZZZZ|nr:hypothetical protein [Actinomycetota bacterium]
MILESLEGVRAVDVADRTGWMAKPEGMCRGDVCVPAPGALRSDGTIDVPTAADRLGMPVLHDASHGVWALGPATATGRALSTAAAADPTLIDRDGNPFRLSTLHGRKVLLVAWSSY